MASSQPRGAERMIHQDYIARIRYSNALPPPPNPPKLLDIPNTGLASGQYTNPGFASRLARDQPLNIEADAELGMPLDLVGMPGIFDGDESSIQAPLQPPVPHPHDRSLLRPLSTLGKPKFSDAGVSFLRRTEYISSHQSRSRFDSTTSKSLIDKTGGRPKGAAVFNLDKESPEFIRSQIEKGFQDAASFIREPNRVKHPTKKNLKLVSAHPILPDLDAFPDAGGYIAMKFLVNPVPPSSTYDVRLERSVLRPVQPSEEEQLLQEQQREAWERDPEHNPVPANIINYEFYLTQTAEAAQNFKRKWSVYDDERDDDDLYSNKNGDDEGCFRLKRIRAYEQASMSGSVAEKYDEEVMIAVHDGSDGLHQKAAYYYPIIQKTSIRPQRNKNIHKHKTGYGASQNEDDNTDFVDVRIEDPREDVRAVMASFKENPLGETDEGEEANGEQPSEEQARSSSPAGRDEDDEKKSD